MNKGSTERQKKTEPRKEKALESKRKDGNEQEKQNNSFRSHREEKTPAREKSPEEGNTSETWSSVEEAKERRNTADIQKKKIGYRQN